LKEGKAVTFTAAIKAREGVLFFADRLEFRENETLEVRPLLNPNTERFT